MDKEPQFHITVVTRRRRSRSGEGPRQADPQAQIEAARRPVDSAPAERERADRRPSLRSHTHHHRVYRDYGSVNLGALPEHSAATHRQESAASASDRQEQRRFMEQYAPVLSRKYRQRDNARLLWRLLPLALALIAALVLFFGRSGADIPVEEPGVETAEQIEQVDLDDLNGPQD